MSFAEKLDRLAAPARPPRPAVAGHARPLPHLALGSDAAADPGRRRHPLLRAISARIPDRRARWPRRRRTKCCGSGAGWATTRAAATCTRRPSRSPTDGFPRTRRRDRRAARRRPLDRGGDRRVRLRRARRDPRRQREARARAPLRRRRATSCGRWPSACCRSKDIETYTQALMDLGATVCTRNPECDALSGAAARCVARKTGRIAELPAPRPRKALPLRKHDAGSSIWTAARCCSSAGRRRASGAGLWCFPERALAKAATARKLEPIEHGFTHFRLRIQPLLRQRRAPNDTGGLWLDFDEARAAAMPTPVKKLLQDLPRIATSTRRRSAIAAACGRV